VWHSALAGDAGQSAARPILLAKALRAQQPAKPTRAGEAPEEIIDAAP
jgi:hypothetical protein